MSLPARFSPERREISNVTQALKAVVTTTESHGYNSDEWVRIIVPSAFGMDISYIATLIQVTSPTQFVTSIDTTSQLPFLTPTTPPGFTSAQSVPISQLVDNEDRR
jgi:hypothetical protein